jgi:hypothetical protein
MTFSRGQPFSTCVRTDRLHLCRLLEAHDGAVRLHCIPGKRAQTALRSTCAMWEEIFVTGALQDSTQQAGETQERKGGRSGKEARRNPTLARRRAISAKQYRQQSRTQQRDNGSRTAQGRNKHTHTPTWGGGKERVGLRGEGRRMGRRKEGGVPICVLQPWGQ